MAVEFLVTDFKQRFGEKLLWDSGVNVTALEEEDLRCGGLVLQSNMSGTYNLRLSEWAADCMVQQCQFRQVSEDSFPKLQWPLDTLNTNKSPLKTYNFSKFIKSWTQYHFLELIRFPQILYEFIQIKLIV